MDQEARRAEFNRIFDRLPGSNVERIRKVCAAIQVKEGTVRIWRLKAPPRVISERSLTLLKVALARKS